MKNAACYGTYTCLEGKAKLEEKLKENGMWDLFKEIEMPLVYTLYDMEKAGIKADGEALKQYGEQLSGRIKELETTIYDLAGETFNINSPKQLGVILFQLATTILFLRMRTLTVIVCKSMMQNC